MDRITVILWLVVFWLIVAVSLVHSRDLYPGQYAQVDPDTRNWFRNLHNGEGTSCCDTADGVRIEDPDWKENDDGSYEVFARDKWHHIDRAHLVTVPNRYGFAILWWPPSFSDPSCFMPGARG